MRFLKKSEISDYTDYETITQTRNELKMKNNLCNHFLESEKSGGSGEGFLRDLPIFS